MRNPGARALTGITTLLLLLGIFGCAPEPTPQEHPSSAPPAAVSTEPAPARTAAPTVAPTVAPTGLVESRYAPIPRRGACPSVVTKPSTDESIVLGDFKLTTSRPAVVDGDTIRVDGLDESLRLIGIDTEETFKDEGKRALAARDWDEYLETMYAGQDRAHPPKYGTPMGEAAREFGEWFFDGIKEVRLEYDATGRTRGYFGRHLVHVLAKRDGRLVNFNVESVRQGFSPYFVKYGRSERYHEAFETAEREARAAQRGIWADPPAHRCYPDYPIRLKWWAARDVAVQRLAKLAASDPDVVILGGDAAWKTLEQRAGKDVTVASTVSRIRTKGSMGFIHLSHRNGQDFLVVGKKAAIESHPLAREKGNLVLVTGTVSLYKGAPQIAAETVSFRRF